jgi:hypothetical protein
VPGLTVGWAKTAALCDRAAPLLPLQARPEPPGTMALMDDPERSARQTDAMAAAYAADNAQSAYNAYYERPPGGGRAGGSVRR